MLRHDYYTSTPILYVAAAAVVSVAVVSVERRNQIKYLHTRTTRESRLFTPNRVRPSTTNVFFLFSGRVGDERTHNTLL